MGSFFSSLVGTYANVALQRQQVEQSEQDKDRAARVNILTSALASPNFNWQDPTNVNAVLDQLGELTGGGGKGKSGGGGGGSKGKGGKSSGIDHLRTIFERLRGQVPKQEGLQQPLAVNQKSFLTAGEMAKQTGMAKAAEKRVQAQSALDAIQKTNPGYWKEHPDEWQQVVTRTYGVNLPVPKGVIKAVKDPASPTGWSYGDFDPETNTQLGPLQPGAPEPAHTTARDSTIRALALRGLTPTFGPDGTIVKVDPLPGYVDFQKVLATAKQNPARNAGFMTMYAAYRFYNEAIQTNPALLPVVGPLIQNAFSNAGIKTPPGFLDAFTKMPANMPQDVFGNYIGTKMPGSPIAPGAVNQGGLYAQRFLKQEPDIRKEITDNAKWLGPVHGRMAVKYLLYKVGSTGDPAEDRALARLRTNLELTDTNVARMHINSVKAIQGIEQLSDAGKMSPDALLGALDSIHEWAQDAALQGEGKSVFGQPFTANANQAGKADKLPDGGGKQMNAATARQFLDAASGDAKKARELARQHHWKF